MLTNRTRSAVKALHRRGPDTDSSRWRVIRAGFDYALTAFFVLAWIALLPIYVQLISPYSSMGSAVTMTSSLPIAVGLFVHLWRPRTAPWRTVVWAAIASTMTGAFLLTQGFGQFALTAATLVAAAVVATRINSNGRRAWAAIRGRKKPSQMREAAAARRGAH